MKRRRCVAFTLVELLIVIAVIGVLMSVLLPALTSGRRQAWVTKAHHDLREIGLALQQYAEDCGKCPPARTFCAAHMANINDYCCLPDELVTGQYLPEPIEDVFNPGHTYKYLTPGFGWANGAGTFLAVWVPRAFPGDTGPADDKVYYDTRTSPIQFALWSVGPGGPKSVFDSDMLHYPVPPRCWYPTKRDGIVVYLMGPGGPVTSP